MALRFKTPGGAIIFVIIATFVAMVSSVASGTSENNISNILIWSIAHIITFIILALCLSRKKIEPPVKKSFQKKKTTNREVGNITKIYKVNVEKRMRNGHRKKIVSILALGIIITIVVWSWFIPYTKRNEVGTRKEFNTFEFGKRLFIETDWNCYYSQKCQAFYGYEVDAIMVSYDGCINKGKKLNDCYTIYVSRTGALYASAKEAYYDRYDKTNPTISIGFFGDEYERQPYISEIDANECFIYGLYCPSGIEYQSRHISFATHRKQLAVKYRTSNCEVIIDDEHGTYSELCHYANPQNTTIDRALSQNN